ncbi:MAG: hypothetical protein AAAC47_11045 [Pararhizobium sp.]
MDQAEVCRVKRGADKSEHLVAVYPLNAALGILSEAYKDQDLADEIVECATG